MQLRVRRSARDAKQRILETAERLLIEGGPDTVRVQVVARELGITDAAVHHHFGSREGLLEALLRHGARQLQAEMGAEISRWTAGEVDFEGFARKVLDTMERKGYARLAMWLALSGWKERGSGMFTPFVEELHAHRVAAEPSQPPDLDDTRFLSALFLMTLVGEPLFGETVRRSVGLRADRATTRRFRHWLLTRMRALGGTG
jgi:AcrR family transcriptional regulator